MSGWSGNTSGDGFLYFPSTYPPFPTMFLFVPFPFHGGINELFPFQRGRGQGGLGGKAKLWEESKNNQFGHFQHGASLPAPFPCLTTVLGSVGIKWDFNELRHLAWDEFPVFHRLCRDGDGSWHRPSPSRRTERRKDGIK